MQYDELPTTLETLARPVRKTPTAFVATCQCGLEIGALDIERTGPEDTKRLLGMWLMQGCTVAPRFTSNWSARIQLCECGKTPRPEHVCGLQGFGALGDTCRGCDADLAARLKTPNATGNLEPTR